MNLKLSLIFGSLCTVLGFYAGYRINMQEPLVQKQEQTQECKVVTKVITAKDGTKTETTEFVSKSVQHQEALQVKVKSNALFLGLATDKKASASLVLDKWSHEIRTDFNKDHVYQLNYKVLEF